MILYGVLFIIVACSQRCDSRNSAGTRGKKSSYTIGMTLCISGRNTGRYKEAYRGCLANCGRNVEACGERRGQCGHGGLKVSLQMKVFASTHGRLESYMHRWKASQTWKAKHRDRGLSQVKMVATFAQSLHGSRRREYVPVSQEMSSYIAGSVVVSKYSNETSSNGVGPRKSRDPSPSLCHSRQCQYLQGICEDSTYQLDSWRTATILTFCSVPALARSRGCHAGTR